MIWIGWAIAGVYTVVKHDGVQLDKLRGPVLGCEVLCGMDTMEVDWVDLLIALGEYCFLLEILERNIYAYFSHTRHCSHKMGIGIFIL